MFNQCEFGTWVQLAKVYLIHKRSDEEDTPAAASQDIFRGKGIGKGFRGKT